MADLGCRLRRKRFRVATKLMDRALSVASVIGGKRFKAEAYELIDRLVIELRQEREDARPKLSLADCLPGRKASDAGATE